MMIVLEILKFLIPTAGIVLIAYWFINRPVKLEKLKHEAECRISNFKTITPVRLNAYERLTLFLERTSPDQLLNRELEGNISCFDFQMRLLKVIREEYEHNVTQQIYVSGETWEAIQIAKDNIVQLINVSATQVKSTDRAYVLAQIILRTYNEVNPTPTKSALEQLKTEVSRFID